MVKKRWLITIVFLSILCGCFNKHETPININKTVEKSKTEEKKYPTLLDDYNRRQEALRQPDDIRKIVQLNPGPQGRLVFGIGTYNFDTPTIYSVQGHMMNADGTNDRIIAKMIPSSSQSLKISPNGRWLAFESDYGKIQILNLDTGRRLRTFEGDQDYCWDNHNKLYFEKNNLYSEKGNQLYSEGNHLGIYRYDPATNSKTCLVSSGSSVLDFNPAPSPSGKNVAYVHHKHSTEYWVKLISGRVLDSGKSLWDEWLMPVWISENELFYHVSTNSFVVDITTGEKKLNISSSSPVVLSPNRKHMIGWIDADNTYFYEVDVPAWKEKQHEFFSKVKGVAFSPSGKEIAIAGDDRIYIHRFGVGTEVIYKPKDLFPFCGIDWTK